MKKWFGVWITIIGWLALAPAALAAQNAPSAQAPEKVVSQAASQALHALSSLPKAKLAKPAEVNKLVSRYILPEVDIDASAKLVLGHYWRTATPAQRSAFVEQFKELLIRTYSKSISQYQGTKIEYLNNRNTVNGPFAKVYTRVIPPGHESISVVYSLFKTKAGWKIYDVTLSGLSLIQSYRSQFSTEIQQTSLEALINHLKKQNQQAQAGAAPSRSQGKAAS